MRRVVPSGVKRRERKWFEPAPGRVDVGYQNVAPVEARMRGGRVRCGQSSGVRERGGKEVMVRRTVVEVEELGRAGYFTRPPTMARPPPASSTGMHPPTPIPLTPHPSFTSVYILLTSPSPPILVLFCTPLETPAELPPLNFLHLVHSRQHTITTLPNLAHLRGYLTKLHLLPSKVPWTRILLYNLITAHRISDVDTIGSEFSAQGILRTLALVVDLAGSMAERGVEMEMVEIDDRDNIAGGWEMAEEEVEILRCGGAGRVKVKDVIGRWIEIKERVTMEKREEEQEELPYNWEDVMPELGLRYEGVGEGYGYDGISYDGPRFDAAWIEEAEAPVDEDWVPDYDEDDEGEDKEESV